MLSNHRRRRVLRTAAATTATTLCLVLAGSGLAYAVAPNVASRSEQEIRDRVQASGVDMNQDVAYDVAPKLTAPYDEPGDMNAATKQGALSLLNDIRYVAGLDANVELDSTLGKQAQAGAYVDAVLGELTHMPSQPAGMPDSVYRLGYQGTTSSNIAWNYGTLNRAVLGWTEDEDSGNISRVGHRRWILNPRLAKTGFGAAGAYYAFSAFDSSGSGGQTNVAWPAQEMPADWFGSYEPWSLSTGRHLDASAVRVTLKRESDGKTWSFEPGKDNDPTADKYFNVENSGYGQRGCVIFRPDGATCDPGDVYDVAISGAGSEEIDYKVSFFALHPVTSVQLDMSEISLNVGDWIYLDATVSPQNATQSDVIWSTSSAKVATVDEYGEVEAIGRGTATVTAEAGGKTATAEVTVRDPDAERAERIAAIRSSRVVGLSVSAVGKKKVSASWQLEGGAGVTRYQVYKSTSRRTGFSRCGTTKQRRAIISKGLKSKRTYYFKVRGYGNVDGERVYTAWSDTVRVKTR